MHSLVFVCLFMGFMSCPILQAVITAKEYKLKYLKSNYLTVNQ